jgi:hypothetical protein
MPRKKKEDRGSWGDEPLRLVSVELIRAANESRPKPPEEVGEQEPTRFVPDSGFAQWIHDTFISAVGPLANVEHEHLMDAKIGVLWTNCVNVSKQRQILGTAEIPQTMGSTWKRERAAQQLRDWFLAEVDFVLTFYAPEVDNLDHRAFCALVEHELKHCAQAIDNYGAPKFDRNTGHPIFAIRGHDVEEFVSVVARYGVTSSDVQALVNAAKAKPLIGDKPIDIACGTCGLARVA